MHLRNGRVGLIVLATAVLAIGLGAGVAYAQASTTVVMREFSFTPPAMTAGGATRWTLQNAGQFPHNVHIEGNGVSMDVKLDGPVPGGQSFSATVNLAPGRYDV